MMYTFCLKVIYYGGTRNSMYTFCPKVIYYGGNKEYDVHILSEGDIK